MTPDTPPTIEEALATAPPISFDDLPTIIIEKLQTWIDILAAMLPNLVVAFLVFVAFVAFGRMTSAVLRQGLSRISRNDSVNDLLSIVARFALTAVGLFLALGVLNLDGVVTSLLAGVGVVGLALGFAFQDIAANFMSGVIMAFSRPFDVGDFIETGPHLGTVEGIDLRTVRLRTTTGERVLIPNRQVYNDALVNYTETPDRRVDVLVGVAYSDDLELARRAAREAIDQHSMRDDGRPIGVYFERFADSSIELSAQFWIRFRTQQDYLEARSEAVMKLKAAFDSHDLTIPFPIRTLDFGARAVGGASAGEVLNLQAREALH